MDKIATADPRERAALFVEAAGRRPAIPAAVMGKDFWGCWTLRRLFEVLRFRPQLIFKGGTSLSKVFTAIERFSEDVDLSLSRRDLGFADDHDPEQAGISRKEARRRLENLVGECRRVIRERLVPDLRADHTAMKPMIFGDPDELLEDYKKLLADVAAARDALKKEMAAALESNVKESGKP